MPSAEEGRRAEGEAERFLTGLGYRLLARNFRTKAGELDLVLQDGETTVFVEVRSRASNSFGGAAASVTREKRRRVVKAAAAFAQSRGLSGPLRFDVVAFSAGRLEHIPDAFPADR